MGFILSEEKNQICGVLLLGKILASLKSVGKLPWIQWGQHFIPCLQWLISPMSDYTGKKLQQTTWSLQIFWRLEARALTPLPVTPRKTFTKLVHRWVPDWILKACSIFDIKSINCFSFSVTASCYFCKFLLHFLFFGWKGETFKYPHFQNGDIHSF